MAISFIGKDIAASQVRKKNLLCTFTYFCNFFLSDLMFFIGKFCIFADDGLHNHAYNNKE